ncbi:uncharacterized protein ACHE_31331S [Aspergillus chevalieri]|uniref:Uncharacterized protein n=1 Tax=Aspergillus chevalieri TaxID=182096 RepID=A0A7R7VMK9_ASPCH|nr:uncharacterized protein ACHE_31331S [Aspergillus chevalieri]BCR87344.1 hypothetical protein ACHE_31331S [Aspergillus chevalieri]
MQSPPNQPHEQSQPQQQAQGQTHNRNNTINRSNDARPGTPPPPPYSPVTPVFAQLAPVQNGSSGHPIVPPPISSSHSISPASTATPSALPPQDNAQTGSGTGTRPEVATEPPPPVPIGPISESDNPDVIALRSAISILQLQKQQSLRDMRALDRMKKAAAADPERFARELTSGNLKAEDKGGFINLNLSADEDDDDDEEIEGGEGVEGQEDVFSNLGKFPTPQNVVRMPPINWAKYQIVGEPLDKMHAEQLRRPSAGEPLREDLAQRAPEHVLASPYRPLVDKLETPGRATGAGRSRK